MPSEQQLFTQLKRYAVGTFFYGFIHSTACEYCKTKRYFQKSTASYVAKEKLLIDKLGSTALGTVVAPFVWPLMVNEDLRRLECLVRGRDVAEYGD